MAILQRMVHIVYPGKQKEFMAWMKEWTEFTDSHGFPPMTFCSYISGAYEYGAIVGEREWESMGECERAFAELYKNPEAETLEAPSYEIVKEKYAEFLMKMD
jgi:hypothetical protein